MGRRLGDCLQKKVQLQPKIKSKIILNDAHKSVADGKYGMRWLMMMRWLQVLNGMMFAGQWHRKNLLDPKGQITMLVALNPETSYMRASNLLCISPDF